MKSETVLALYPNSFGIGYVCLEWPSRKIIDSGIAVSRPLTNAKLLKRAVKYLDFYRPCIVLLRDCTKPASFRTQRVADLLADVEKHAAGNGLKVFGYSRQQIRDVFEQFGSRSKYEISQKILEWFPELSWRRPRPRKPWMNESINMGVFDALSLAITHRYLTE